MSLDRKDLRVYFSPEVHAALLALADVDRTEPAKLVEQVLEQYVVDRVHAATVIAQRVDVAGLTRIKPVSCGSARMEPATTRVTNAPFGVAASATRGRR